ncbi:isopeptide-forming domain-containing fimbrial protein [Adlercreutzia caecimuris]|uniref:isopeptide-forming domain-containing fimbrial protein n=1 Tax=Adlercreutzia caecimuris TaxID=671266 RepID=UPI001C3EF9B8|nr:isopeptide-forming domain-containing fimbrial protein [Adlercreutzia caecimuris]
MKGGTYGADFTYTPDAVQYNGADYGTSDVVEVLTSAPLVFSDAAGHSKDAPGATGIQVNPGVHAAITLNGVHVSHQIPLNVMTHSLDTDNGTKAMEGAQVRNRTSLYLVLADQSDNSLASSGGHRPGIRCGEGSDLVIDDAVRNLDAAGNMVIPIGGVINREVTLIDGKKLTANSTHTALDSRSPGVLTVSGSGAAAGIGGSCQESGGRITINGGKITASASYGGNDSDTGAGIGGGSGGNTTDTTLAINSGHIESHGGFHSAGIGAGAWNGNNFASLAPPDTILSRNYNYPLAGNIEINGGLITSVGGSHGGGFGTSCHGGTNAGNVIKVTGGTLIPSTLGSTFMDFDAGSEGRVVIAGGSVFSSGRFQGLGGTAYGSEGEYREEDKVFMITVDLGSDGVGNETINKWGLSIDGVPQGYGAPAQFHEGKLYLWLPASAKDKVISIDLGYEREDGTRVEPDTLFRDPASPADPEDPNRTKLKRYEEFELDPSYLAGLKKYYDGRPLEAYDLAARPIAPPKDPDRVLNDPLACDYKYQRFDAVGGNAVSGEVSTGNKMPSDVGIMKFTMISRQYSTTEGFKENYWGHRAFGWCEIWAIPSRVTDVKASWGAGEGADRTLAVEAVVERGSTVDGAPPAADGSNLTKPTCASPEGRVQLYVDGKPVGDPVELRFEDAVLPDGTVLPANAAREGDDAAGHRTRVSLSMTAAAAGLDAAAAGAGEHRVSVRFLPPDAAQQATGAPANYLASEEPSGDSKAPWAPVQVAPDPAIAPAPKLAKRAENLTHPDGPTQPGDRIRYTIEASNGAKGSLWTDVVVSDPLPACLELDEGSVRLDNPRGGVAGKQLSKAPAVAAGDVGRFALSAPGAGGRPALTVPVGDVAGGSSATVTFECTVRAGLDFSDPAAVDLGNVASAEGKRPSPDDPDDPDVGPVAPPDTDPATPPGGGTVAPADPDPRVSKSVENLTAPGAKVTHLGDRLRYAIELSNAGAAGSCLMGAAVSDPLPAGLEPVPGTIRLALDGGEPIEVPDAAYDEDTRTIAVSCGDLWGGHTAALTFECVVGEAALEQNTANIAHAHGEVPSESPGSRPEDPDPGKPAEPPAGEPEASSPPASPAPVVPGDPAEDDVAIAKTAENLTRDDGATRVGDTVRYRIALSNSKPGTGWMDAVIRDDVPAGLEPVAGTLKLTLPDGNEIAVDDAAYDPKTRVLAVACGHLYGGQEAVLVFDALVTGEAASGDIGNVAVGLGTPPSAWDPDGDHPEPGQPFDPPGGWDAYEKSHPRVESDPAYPPGVDRLGGVRPPDDPGSLSSKKRGTIVHRLPRTGDALAAAALLPAAAALAAGAALLAARRRERAGR